MIRYVYEKVEVVTNDGRGLEWRVGVDVTAPYEVRGDLVVVYCFTENDAARVCEALNAWEGHGKWPNDPVEAKRAN